MHQSGSDFDFSQFITSEEIQQIKNAEKTLENPEALKPYFEYFKEKIPYWKLKLGLYL